MRGHSGTSHPHPTYHHPLPVTTPRGTLDRTTYRQTTLDGYPSAVLAPTTGRAFYATLLRAPNATGLLPTTGRRTPPPHTGALRSQRSAPLPPAVGGVVTRLAAVVLPPSWTTRTTHTHTTPGTFFSGQTPFHTAVATPTPPVLRLDASLQVPGTLPLVGRCGWPGTLTRGPFSPPALHARFPPPLAVELLPSRTAPIPRTFFFFFCSGLFPVLYSGRAGQVVSVLTAYR